MVYQVFNGQRKASFDFCVGVARAFDLRPEIVLREAGLLPPVLPAVEDEETLLEAYRRLHPAVRRAILLNVQSLASLEVDWVPDILADQREAQAVTNELISELAEDFAALPAEDQQRIVDFARRLRPEGD